MLGNPYYAFVDSDYALEGEAGKFTYKINIPKNREYTHVSLLQASIPKTYYLVREGANSLILTEDSSTVSIDITPGNYSMHSFRSVLQSLLTSHSPNGYTYIVSQPNTSTQSSTGKYTITVSGNGLIQPIISFPSSSGIYAQCGFAEGSSNQFAADTLVSSRVVNFNNITGLMVLSNMIEGIGADSRHGSAVLQEIYQFNTTDYSNVGFQNADPLNTAKPLISSHPDVVEFSITDLDDNVINFNGGSVNFSLIIFKKDYYHELATRDLKMKWFQELQQDQEEKK
jgi:hypothetical protein